MREVLGPSGVRIVRLVLFVLLLAGAAGQLVPAASALRLLEPMALRYSSDGVVTEAGRLLLVSTWRAVSLAALAGAGLGLLLLWVVRLVDDGREAADLLAPSPPPLGRQAWLGLGLLAGLAMAMRLPGMQSPLGYDEAFTVLSFVDPKAPWKGALEFTTLNNHPLFSICAALASAAFGASEQVYRLPSLLAGSATPLVAFAIARRWGGSRAGMFAGLLVSASPALILYSRSARGYAMLALASLLASLALLRALERPSQRRWLAYSIAVALGSWVNVLMLLLPVAQLAGALAVAARRKRRGAPTGFVSSMFGAAVVALGLLLIVYSPILHKLLFWLGPGSDRPRVPQAETPHGWLDRFLPMFTGVDDPSLAWWAFGAVLLGGVAWSIAALPESGLIAVASPALALAATSAGLYLGASRFSMGLVPLVLTACAAGLAAFRGPWVSSSAFAVALGLEAGALPHHWAQPVSNIERFSVMVEARVSEADGFRAEWRVAPLLEYYSRGRLRARSSGPGGRTFVACLLDCDDGLYVQPGAISSVEVLTIPYGGGAYGGALLRLRQVDEAAGPGTGRR